MIPSRENIYAAVRIRFLYASAPDAKEVGGALADLVRLRNEADYKLDSSGRFRTAKDASDAIAKATAIIDLLDDIESDPARQAEVVVAIRP